MSSPAATSDMASTLPSILSPQLESPSKRPSAYLLLSCSDPVAPVSNTTSRLDPATSVNSPVAEPCTLTEKRTAVTLAAQTWLSSDLDSNYECMLAWRKCRADLANYNYENEETDGCSNECEFTPEQQKKIARRWVLRPFEDGSEEASVLKAEIEVENAEETAALATLQAERNRTTNEGDHGMATDVTEKVNYIEQRIRSLTSINDTAPSVSTAEDTRPITLATSATIYGDPIEAQPHRDETSYRVSTSYHRPAKKQKLYSRGPWAPPRSGWLNTSGAGIKDATWERDARDSVARGRYGLRERKQKS